MTIREKIWLLEVDGGGPFSEMFVVMGWKDVQNVGWQSPVSYWSCTGGLLCHLSSLYTTGVVHASSRHHCISSQAWSLHWVSPHVYSLVSVRPFRGSWESWDDVQCAFTRRDHILHKYSVFFSCQWCTSAVTFQYFKQIWGIHCLCWQG